MILDVEGYYTPSNRYSKGGNLYVVATSCALKVNKRYHLYSTRHPSEHLRTLFYAMLDEIWGMGKWSLPSLNVNEKKNLSKEDFYLEVEYHLGSAMGCWCGLVGGRLRRFTNCPVGEVTQITVFPKSFRDLDLKERDIFLSKVLHWCNEMGLTTILEKYRPLFEQQKLKEKALTPEYFPSQTHPKQSELLLN